jgi:hypothetical protein
VNENLRKYAFDLAEDYIVFNADSGYGDSEWMTVSAYVSARIKNVQDELLRYTIEQIKEMGVDV